MTELMEDMMTTLTVADIEVGIIWPGYKRGLMVKVPHAALAAYERGDTCGLEYIQPPAGFAFGRHSWAGQEKLSVELNHLNGQQAAIRPKRTDREIALGHQGRWPIETVRERAGLPRLKPMDKYIGGVWQGDGPPPEGKCGCRACRG